MKIAIPDIKSMLGAPTNTRIYNGVEEHERSDGGFEMTIKSRGQNAVHFVRSAPFAAIIPGDSVAEAVITSGISQFLSLYNAALIGRLVLTWFPNPPEVIVTPLATVCDPYLNLFRGIIPPLGGTIDLSPILAFVVLDLFTNSAAALPCEVGPDGKPVYKEEKATVRFPGSGFMSRTKEAWMKRQAATEQRRRQQQQKNGPQA